MPVGSHVGDESLLSRIVSARGRCGPDLTGRKSPDPAPNQTIERHRGDMPDDYAQLQTEAAVYG